MDECLRTMTIPIRSIHKYHFMEPGGKYDLVHGGHDVGTLIVQHSKETCIVVTNNGHYRDLIRRGILTFDGDRVTVRW